MNLTSAKQLRGEITVPGDKSISHRAVMFASLSQGLTEVTNFLQGADCLSTISCFRKLGIEIEISNSKILIHGKGLRGLTAPSSVLDVGNSGTTLRLISGILSPQNFSVTLTGDSSIQKRPMGRIMEPLQSMGATFTCLKEQNYVPLQITGSPLDGIHYHSKVASAQVKSAILLAGLYAKGSTSVSEPVISRNHTELMLSSFGADLSVIDKTVTIQPEPKLTGQAIHVPGDISSAAYFIAAGLLVENSELLIKNVGINPTRDGILKVARAMGGNITLLNEQHGPGEPTADILVKSSTLHGTVIEGDIIPTLIDELPIIAVMAAFADGVTIIKDASELKVKESNRIDVMVANLSSMGCEVQATEDGMIITGGSALHGAKIDTHMDHRIAMSFAIAALCASGTTELLNSECVSISYPDFFHDLKKLKQD